ncbi:MAG: ribonuclease H-like domain-containing protein [Clostridia bacterium]|nr:ribonuclease H-like domain-containing protein [Clostridia bacterium]
MPSGLRSRLRAMQTTPTPPARPQRDRGLLCYRAERNLEPGILALEGAGLRRIGWTHGVFDVRKCLFLDTETTGLSHGAGTVAFLVGAGYIEDDAFIIEQFLMRDYSDEPELLDKLATLMERFDSICTFNGRTFDIPLLEVRYTMCRMRDRWRELEHLDLLTPSRRAWKLRLGSCKLSRLEEMVLGIHRDHDLPGSEVPQRYFEFLKQGDLSLLTDIVRHNEQDIATLATLLTRLTALYAHPEALQSRMDQFSIGKALEMQGEWTPARAVYRIAAIPAPVDTLESLRGNRLSAQANWRIYHIERRSHNDGEMREVLQAMLRRGQMLPEVLIELSKIAEHKDKNLREALEYAEKARSSHPDPQMRPDIERRIQRLNHKLEIQRR